MVLWWESNIGSSGVSRSQSTWGEGSEISTINPGARSKQDSLKAAEASPSSPLFLGKCDNTSLIYLSLRYKQVQAHRPSPFQMRFPETRQIRKTFSYYNKDTSPRKIRRPNPRRSRVHRSLINREKDDCKMIRFLFHQDIFLFHFLCKL